MKLIKKNFTSCIILAFLVNLPLVFSLANVTYSGPLITESSTSKYDILITPVTAPNEEVVINGQSYDFTDPLRLAININQRSAINFIPTNLFKYFPKVTQVSIVNASVTTLVPNAFMFCSSLKEIIMNDNPLLKELPSQFAQSCTNITKLALNKNGIEIIQPDALQGLTELTEINLVDNKIKCIPANFFATNRKMYWIAFALNQLTRLNVDAFVDLPKMQYLTFQGNLITYLPYFNVTVGTVYVGANPIQAIHPSFFTSFFSMPLNFQVIAGTWNNPQCGMNNASNPYQGYRILRDNYTTFSDTCLPCFNNYTTALDNFDSTCGLISTTTSTSTTSTTVDSSTVTSTPQNNPNEALCATHKVCRYYLDSFDHYTCVIKGAEWTVSSISGDHFANFGDENVTRVYFMESRLSQVPNILFTKFINLNYLYIRNCSLSFINEQTFNMCGNLEFLDASFNEITKIAETSLRNCTKLKTIDVTGNSIDYLSTKFYDFEPSLKRIHLHRNEDFELA